MREHYESTQQLFTDRRDQWLNIVSRLFSVLAVTAPYYWVPVIPFTIWDSVKNTLVIVSLLVFTAYLVETDATILLPDRKVSLLLLTLPVALLPGLVKVNSAAGVERYVNYSLLIAVLIVYVKIVRHRGIDAIRRYRHYVVLAMVPQVLYVFLVGIGLVEPITMPSVFANTSEPAGASFSSVQTQFSISIAITVPLILGYITQAYERNNALQLLWIFVLIPVAVAFIKSHGRSGMLAGMVGVIVFTVLYRRRLVLYLAAVTSLVGAGLLYYYKTTVLKYTRLAYGLNGFTSNRLTLFIDALDLFLGAPILGIGYGNRTFPVDNLYLATIVEAGFLPGVLIVVFVGTVVVTGYRVVHRFQGTDHEILATSLFAAVVCYLPVTLFERGIIFLNFYLNVSWWICLGSLLMLPVLEGDTKR